MTKIQVGVLGLVLGKENKFLLTRRNQPNNSTIDKKWQFIGGKIEFGESPENALNREMIEELGVIPTTLFEYPLIISKVWTKEDGGDLSGTQVIMLTYLVDIGKQVPRLNQEISEFSWFTLAEVKKLNCLPYTYETLVKAQAIKKRYNTTSILEPK